MCQWSGQWSHSLLNFRPTKQHLKILMRIPPRSVSLSRTSSSNNEIIRRSSYLTSMSGASVRSEPKPCTPNLSSVPTVSDPATHEELSLSLLQVRGHGCVRPWTSPSTASQHVAAFLPDLYALPDGYRAQSMSGVPWTSSPTPTSRTFAA